MSKLSGVGVNGYGFTFNRKSGKVIQTLEGNVPMLRMAGMKLSATRDYVVVGKDNLIYAYYEGRKDTMPHICDDMVGMDAKKIGIDISQF